MMTSDHWQTAETQFWRWPEMLPAKQIQARKALSLKHQKNSSSSINAVLCHMPTLHINICHCKNAMLISLGCTDWQDITGLNCIKGASGKVIVDDKGIKDCWKEYMEKLMNEENEWDHKISVEVKEGPADCIRMDEVRAALKKMKRHKAPGLSGLVTEMIQATGDTGECFFWYRPTRVVPDQRPLNGRCCCLFFTGSRGSSLYNIAEWYAILECGW